MFSGNSVSGTACGCDGWLAACSLHAHTVSHGQAGHISSPCLHTCRYLSQHAKALYVRRAVQMYNGIFADMDAFMSRVQLKQSASAVAAASSSGTDVPDMTFQDFMATLKAYVGG